MSAADSKVSLDRQVYDRLVESAQELVLLDKAAKQG
jgi:hypothetical protein